jgi:hypothetical protein
LLALACNQILQGRDPLGRPLLGGGRLVPLGLQQVHPRRPAPSLPIQHLDLRVQHLVTGLKWRRLGRLSEGLGCILVLLSLLQVAQRLALELQQPGLGVLLDVCGGPDLGDLGVENLRSNLDGRGRRRRLLAQCGDGTEKRGKKGKDGGGKLSLHRYLWQRGQKKLDRCPIRRCRIGMPQVGQGSPARSYTFRDSVK